MTELERAVAGAVHNKDERHDNASNDEARDSLLLSCGDDDAAPMLLGAHTRRRLLLFQSLLFITPPHTSASDSHRASASVEPCHRLLFHPFSFSRFLLDRVARALVHARVGRGRELRAPRSPRCPLPGRNCSHRRVLTHRVSCDAIVWRRRRRRRRARRRRRHRGGRGTLRGAAWRAVPVAHDGRAERQCAATARGGGARREHVDADPSLRARP